MKKDIISTQPVRLEVSIPGPKALEDSLETVEKTFLERAVPGAISLMEKGLLWQNY